MPTKEAKDRVEAGREAKPLPKEPSEAAPPAAPGKLPYRLPPEQQPHEEALRLGFEALLSRPLATPRLKALGASRQAANVRLPILNRHLLINLEQRQVSVENGGRARAAWALLAIHYLSADDVATDMREVSFSSFADGQFYAGVFAKRIIGRFLATTGRNGDEFARLSEELHAIRLPGPGLAYRFQVLPRVPVSIIRYDGDDELPPGATVIYRADAEYLLPAEDRVVAAELLLDALAGKPVDETPPASSPGRA